MMKEKLEPIIFEGEIIDLENISEEKIEEILAKLQEKQILIREKVDNVLKNGDKQELVELLTELKNVQQQLSILKFADFDKKTTAKVSQKVTKKREFVESEAKRFGQDPEIASESLSEYGSSIEGVRSEYEDEFKVLLVALGKGQEREILETITAQKIKDGDSEVSGESLDDKLEDIDSLRETISKLEDYISTCIERCNQKIDEVTEEQSLVEPKRKNGIFGNFFRKFTDKIDGKNKFDDNVIKPLNEKTKSIKNLLPIIKNIIRDQLISKLIEICATEKGAATRAIITQKITEMLPMMGKVATTVGSIVTSTAGVQALAIAGLATAAIVTTKVIVDKVKENKEKNENGESGEIPDKTDDLALE